MAERLIPCGACLRHVRRSEAACPFCGAAVSMGPPAQRELFRRMAATAAVAAGVAALTECSSGGGPAPGPSEGFGGGSSGSLAPPYGAFPVPGNGITCRTSAACLPGQVCCGEFNMSSSCQAGPCSPTPMPGVLQLCGISAECLVAGDICGLVPALGLMACNPPSDSGAADESGIVEGGSSGDAKVGADAGSSDAEAGD
jgi:hypothetical protein